MSEFTDAAQKWAEAKATLAAADSAYDAAKEAYAKAEDAEFHAWQAMEALSGRVSPAPVEREEVAYVTLPKLPDAHRHSLPVKPIG